MTKGRYVIKPYELALLLHRENARGSTGLNSVKERILAHKGLIKSENESLGERTLAYPIAKQSRGRYVILQLDMDPTELKATREDIDLVDGVLRYLFVARS